MTVWDVRENRLRIELTPPEPVVRISGFAFTPDGSRLAVAVTKHDGSGSLTRALQLWDLGSGRQEYEIADAGANNIAISPDGSLLVTSAGSASTSPPAPSNAASSAPVSSRTWSSATTARCWR